MLRPIQIGQNVFHEKIEKKIEDRKYFRFYFHTTKSIMMFFHFIKITVSHLSTFDNVIVEGINPYEVLT